MEVGLRFYCETSRKHRLKVYDSKNGYRDAHIGGQSIKHERYLKEPSGDEEKDRKAVTLHALCRCDEVEPELVISKGIHCNFIS